MDKLTDVTAPARERFRQLQKIIQDIKKSDGSLLDKLRRLKSKPLPKLPARDYRALSAVSDVDQLPDPDHVSPEQQHCCMYEEEQDDQYEPPPCQAMLPSANRASFSREDYLDNRCNFPLRPPRKPVCPSRNISKPQRPRASNLESDEDYIDPDESNNEDNYVEPAEDPAASQQVPSSCAPHTHTNCTQAASRSPNLSPPRPAPGRPAPRWHQPATMNTKCVTQAVRAAHSTPVCLRRERKKSKHRSTNEVTEASCEAGECNHFSLLRGAESLFFIPLKQSPLLQKPDLKPREFETGRRGASGPMDPEKAPHQTPNLDICNKPWYAGACDRKTADEVLIRSNKDGAFMVRKSSGQDAQQPYTLVVFYNGRVYNIPIRFVPATQQYALGREKSGEEYFSSVAHIIENHRRTPLVLIDGQNNTKDTTSLSHPVKPH
uniref:B cell linker n=1 Tax=Tetraodon nigroviridis TaxID=99883 RepID=H3C3E0_TETNG